MPAVRIETARTQHELSLWLERRNALLTIWPLDKIGRTRRKGTGSARIAMRGVRRAWRGHGIARALKQTQVAWAKRKGFTRLVTETTTRRTHRYDG